jgi:hypothetical protein
MMVILLDMEVSFDALHIEDHIDGRVNLVWLFTSFADAIILRGRGNEDGIIGFGLNLHQVLEGLADLRAPALG